MPAKKSKEVVDVPETKLDFIKFILGLLLIAALIGLAALYQKYTNIKKDLALSQDPQAQEDKFKAEAKELVDKVSKLMVLPEGEPTIATVADSQALAEQQQFFKNAQNGDKVLIYKDTAIIYNPTENRIVNVGPVLMDGDQAAKTNPQEFSVEIRNGSQKIGVANELGDSLKKAGFNVATVGNAANPDYQETILVNANGKDVKALEEQLKVTATDKLPAGEASSSQDVIIILGNNK